MKAGRSEHKSIARSTRVVLEEVGCGVDVSRVSRLQTRSSRRATVVCCVLCATVLLSSLPQDRDIGAGHGLVSVCTPAPVQENAEGQPRQQLTNSQTPFTELRCTVTAAAALQEEGDDSSRGHAHVMQSVTLSGHEVHNVLRFTGWSNDHTADQATDLKEISHALAAAVRSVFGS